MKNNLMSRSVKILGVVLAIAALVYVLKPMIASHDPSDAKMAKLSEELTSACQANKIEPQLQLLQNGELVEVYTPSEFIAAYADESTSIPYDKKERGRMYPFIELFDIKENVDYIQLLTCSQNQKIVLSRNDVLARPDPLYWMSKRKGFISVHSMVYNQTSDTSEKTGFKARPILIVNLIDDNDPNQPKGPVQN